MANSPRGTTDSPIQITMLGRFTVRPNGSNPMRVPTRVQHLLAYLLLNPNREFRRAHLAEVLWGSRRQAASRKHLRQALWGLRAGISAILPGHDLLRCQGEWVRAIVDDHVSVDANVFDHATRLVSVRMVVPLSDETVSSLGQACRLYEGDLLDGWDQEWCAAPREHLRRRFLTVMDILTSHFEAVGDDDRATSAAVRSLEIDPARESAHRCLIRFLLRAGDRSGAVRQYRACESVVRDELGVAPDEATKALYEEIVKGGRG